MGKRQNLTRLSITLFLIMALTASIIFVAGIDFGAKGGLVNPGDEGYVSRTDAAFAGMPDSSNFVTVSSSNISTMKQPKSDNIITTADEFVSVFLNAGGEGSSLAGTYTLGADFKIVSSTFLAKNQLTVKTNAVIDGAGHSIIVDYSATDDIIGSGNHFGGLFRAISEGATIKNLNYYLAPSALVMMAYNDGQNSALNLGGFAGIVDKGAKVLNCNFNIFGTVYGIRMNNNVHTDGRPRIGGVFGRDIGTVKNCTFNLVNATVSASSHTDDTYSVRSPHRQIGGVIGSMDLADEPDKSRTNRLDNCVFNVTPSSIVGADLLGYYSVRTNLEYNEVGLYIGNTNDTYLDAQTSGNTFINYNGMFGSLDSLGNGKTSRNYAMPYLMYYSNKGHTLNKSKNHYVINANGASYYGDDFYFVANTDDTMSKFVNPRNLVGASGKPKRDGTDAFVKSKHSVASNGSETLDFFYDASQADYANGFLIKDTYTWNRLVSVSGTAYFDADLKSTPGAKVSDPLDRLAQQQAGFADKCNRMKAMRQKVVIDTAGHGGTFALEPQAAAAFALYANITGNNGDRPEDNVFDISNMTRVSGAIKRFGDPDASGRGKGSIKNMYIVNETGVNDGSALYPHVGGFIDYVSNGSTIENCKIDNAFNYTKTGIVNPSMRTDQTNGNLYVGGVFGYVSGTIKNCEITAKSDITIRASRVHGDANSTTTDHIYIGGFAGNTYNLTLESSIVNVVASNMSIDTGYNEQGMMAGFVAKADAKATEQGEGTNAFSVLNSKISSQMQNASAQTFGGSDSTIAGLVAYNKWLGGNISLKNSRIDLQIACPQSATVNYASSYLVGHMDSSYKINMENVAVNMNDMFSGFDSTKASTITSVGNVTMTNTWFYNAGDMPYRGAGSGNINTISIKGANKANNADKRLTIKSLHNLTIADLAVTTNGSSPIEKACKQFEFFAQPATAFYDEGKVDRFKFDPSTMTEDELNTYVANGKIFDAYTSPIDSFLGRNKNIGWLKGKNVEQGSNFLIGTNIGNQYVAKIYPVLKNGTGVDEGKKLIDYYNYSLITPNGSVNNHHVVALLDTYEIRNGAEWNQVANNTNAGLSRTWLDKIVYNDIRPAQNTALSSIGYDASHAFVGTIAGRYDDTVIDEKTGAQKGYPTIYADIIQSSGAGNVGLVGYLGKTGEIKQLKVVGASLRLQDVNVGQDIDYNYGIVAGVNEGTISNVDLLVNESNTIKLATTKTVSFGLLVGKNTGTIENSTINVEGRTSVKVSNILTAGSYGNIYMGGITGYHSHQSGASESINNVVVNLSSFVFDQEKRLDSSSVPVILNVKVGGAIGYIDGYNTASTNANGANSLDGIINGIYLSLTQDNFAANLESVAGAMHVMDGTNIGDAAFKSVVVGSDAKLINELSIYRTFNKAPLDATYTHIVKVYVGDKEDDIKLASSATVLFKIGTNLSPIVTVKDIGTFAVANFIRGGKSLSHDTSYQIASSDLTGNLNKAAFEIIISLVTNDIKTVDDWNNIAYNVGLGSTFRGYVFKVNPLGGVLTFNSSNNTPSVIADTKVFEGSIVGVDNAKILIENANHYSASSNVIALIGNLGVDGSIRDLNIELVGRATYGASEAAAILVAKNAGTIDNVKLTVQSNNVERKVEARYAGLLVGMNTGVISNVTIDASGHSKDKAYVVVSSLKNGASDAASGIIAGLSTGSKAVIENITMTTSGVQVVSDDNNGMGLLVGKNTLGAKMDTVVNALKSSYSDQTIQHYYNENMDYFVGTFDNKEDMVNVWMLNDLNQDLTYSGVLGYDDTVFNVMGMDLLGGNSGSIKADAAAYSVTFTTETIGKNSNFYGYVTNFDKIEILRSDKTYSVMNGQGVLASAVFAKKDIEDIKDLKNLSKYSTQTKINGLKFEMAKNAVIYLERAVTTIPDPLHDGQYLYMVDWKPIPYFNHFINGGQGCAIKTRDVEKLGEGGAAIPNTIVTADDIFYGLFGEIGPAGGLTNIELSFATSVGRGNYYGVPKDTKDIDGIVAKVNNGYIDNVNVKYNGIVTAKESAGVIVGHNAVTGVIDHATVNFVYNEASNANTASHIFANNAGIIAGSNDGIISNMNVNFSVDTAVYGRNVGSVVGHNTNKGVIFAANNTVSSVINGQLVGVNMGGIAGVNDGVINGMNINIDKWYAFPDKITLVANLKDKMTFGGATGVNNGLIESSIINHRADSEIAGLKNIAGLAVTSSGYVGDTVVNINKRIKAKDFAAGLIHRTEAKSNVIINRDITSSEVAIGNAVVDSTVNVMAPIEATEAVGFVYSNSAALSGVDINLEAKIQGVKYASMMGKEVFTSSPANKLQYKLPETADAYIRIVVEDPLTQITNRKVIIRGTIKPNATGIKNNRGEIVTKGVVSATYKDNSNNVKYDESWLVRNNNYAIDKGSIDLNEYKGVTINKIDVTGTRTNETLRISTSGDSNTIIMRDEKVDSFVDLKGTAENPVDSNAYKQVFVPNSTDNGNGRVIIVSEYLLDIANEDDYSTVNKNLVEKDLFYGVVFRLNNSLTLNDSNSASIAPMGSTYEFNSIFVGNNPDPNKNVINLNRSLINETSGLFGIIGEVGEVKNIILNVGFDVALGSSASKYSGGLAGIVKGKLTNVAVNMANDMDETRLPKIEANTMSGALAGLIDENAVLTNVWLFMQNGRYVSANGIVSHSGQVVATSERYNVVNLGGVTNVDVSFTNGDPNSIFTVDIKMNNDEWRDVSSNTIISRITNVSGTTKYKLPTDGFNVIRANISLINKSIDNLADLNQLAANQRGFDIAANEVFTLTSNIIIGNDLAQDKYIFNAIGLNSDKPDRQFKATFDGNGKTITIAKNVVMSSFSDDTSVLGDVAGLFGALGETAVIKNLRIVYNDGSSFAAKNFAGGLAGVNKSSNINNVLVDFRTTITKTAGDTYNVGAVFGNSTSTNNTGVYVVKHYENDITPIGDRNTDDGINIINIYSKGAEVFNIDFNASHNDLVANVDSKLNMNASLAEGSFKNMPFFGLIDTTSTDKNADFKNNVTIANAKGNANKIYAAVFVNTDIGSAEDFVEMAKYIDLGFNVRGLVYKALNDIVVGDDSKASKDSVEAIASTNNNALNATLDGAGHTVTIRNMTFTGQNAGFVGSIAAGGVIRNLVIDVANTTFGGTKAVDGVDTTNAAILTTRNEGEIYNVFVYNRDKIGDKSDGGVKFTATNSNNLMVTANTGTISNVWYAQNNVASDFDANINRAINVLRIAGKDLVLQNFAFTIASDDITNATIKFGDKSTLSSVGGVHLYDMTDQKTDLIQGQQGSYTLPVNTSANGNKYVVTDFDLIINSEQDFRNFTTVVNHIGGTSLKGIEVSLEATIDAGKDSARFALPHANTTFDTIGTKERPFDGIFNGNNVKFIIEKDVKFSGTEYGGIFGNIGANGVIKNVEIYMYGFIDVAPAHNSVKDTYSDVVAGVIAYNKGTIKDVIIVANFSVENVNVVGKPVDYSGNVNIAGGVTETTKALVNVWFSKSTSSLLKASNTVDSVSHINKMTLVGEMARMHTVINNDGVTFEVVGGVGEIYKDFNKSNVEKGSPSITRKNGISEVYEWVNYRYADVAGTRNIVFDAKSLAQLAIDTKAGYTFNGRPFVVAEDIRIEAKNANSLAEFGGELKPFPTVTASTTFKPNIIIVADSEATTGSYFSLFNKLNASAKITNVNISIGTDDNYLEIAVPAQLEKNARGFIANTNGGVISGGEVRVYANINSTGGKAQRFSVFVGTNNNKIIDETISVYGRYDSASSTQLGVYNVDKLYGNIAISNLGTIENDTVNINGAKIYAGDGYFSYAVAKNEAKDVTAVIKGLKVNVYPYSTLTASIVNVDTYVGGLIGINNGILDESIIEFKELTNETGDVIANSPTVGEFYLEGYKSAFFVGKNVNKAGNLLAIANNDIGDVVYKDPTSGIEQDPSMPRTQTTGYINSARESKSYVDINEGSNTNKNIWIVIDDSDPMLSDKINTKFANVIVLVGAGDIRINKNAINKEFTFTAVGAKEGLEFNGWYNKDTNTRVYDIDSNRVDFTEREVLNKRYEAVFLATIIKTEKDWNDLANLVNGGKDVNAVTFKLNNDITLTNPTPIGNKVNDASSIVYQGMIDGQHHTITLEGKIVAQYAGLFGYADGAKIKNINVINNADIEGKKAAGILVAYANNTEITGSIVSGTRKVIEVTNNASVKGKTYAGGIAGYIGGNSFIKLSTTKNNASIEAVDSIESYAGGIVGYNLNGLLGGVQIENTGEIRGLVAGGIVGEHASTTKIDGFQVFSAGNATIYGGQASAGVGAIINSEAVLDHGSVNYSTNRAEAIKTSAVAFTYNGTISNTWVVTTPSTKYIVGDKYVAPKTDSNAKNLNNGNNSIRILRSENINDIMPAVTTATAVGELTYRSRLDKDSTVATYDFWRYTDQAKYENESFYTKKDVHDAATPAFDPSTGFMDVSGVRKTQDALGTAVSIDITLEKLNEIDTIDELRALAVFGHNKFANSDEYANNKTGGKSYAITADLDLAAETTKFNIDLLGFTLESKNANDKRILTIDGETKFSNGYLDNIIVAININETAVLCDNTNNAERLTLNGGVVLSDSKVYRNAGDLPLPSGPSEYAAASVYGKYDLKNVKTEGNPIFLTRDYALRNSNPTVAFGTVEVQAFMGNVPLTVVNNVVTGCNTGNYATYDHGESGNMIYFFNTELSASNAEMFITELDLLLEDGYTFAGKTLHMIEDITLGANNLTVGSDVTTAFDGKFEGRGNTLTYNDTYNPLFANLGDNAVLENFVINVKVGSNPIFQGGNNASSTMKNIVIINNSIANRYPEAPVNYINVVVVQPKNVADGTQPYTSLYEVLVDKDVYGITGSVEDIMSKNVVITKDVNVSATGDYSAAFNINLGKANAGYIFAGFNDVEMSVDSTNPTLPLEKFANGINVPVTGVVHDSQRIFAYSVSDTISDVDSWNKIAIYVAPFATSADTIKIGSALTLDINTLKSMKSALNGATIDGQGNKITLSGDVTQVSNPLFDAYAGNINNLVVDASGLPGVLASNVLDNDKATTFKNVIVITKQSDAMGIADLPVATNGYVSVVLSVGATLGASTNNFIINIEKDDTSFIHITDSDENVVTAGTIGAYGVLDFSANTVTNKVYKVEKLLAINNDIQLKSLNGAVPVGSNITVGIANNFDILNDTTIDNVNLIIDGQGMIITNKAAFNIANATLKNVAIKGNKTVNITSGTFDNILLIAPVAISAGTFTNAWGNVDYTGVSKLDFSNAQEVVGQENVDLYTVTYESGKFNITMKNTENTYFSGLNNGGAYVACTDAVNMKYTLSADTIGAFEFADRKIDSLATYNAMVDKLNLAGSFLEGKTFELVANVDVADNTITATTKDITINGNKYTISINAISTNVLENVTLTDVILIYNSRVSGGLKAKIGEKAVIVTYDDFTPEEGQIVAVKDYNVINIVSYDTGSKYSYDSDSMILDILTAAGTDFYARLFTVENKNGAIVETKGNIISSINIKEIPSGIIKVKFFLPVNISVQGSSAIELIEKIVTHDGKTYPMEEEYNKVNMDKEEKVINLDLSDLVLLGYTINDVDIVDYTNPIKFTLTGNKGKNIVLRIKRFNTDEDPVLDKHDTYSYKEITGANPFETIDINEIIPTYVIDARIQYRIKSDIFFTTPNQNASTVPYKRTVEFYYGDPAAATIVGSISYNQFIDPFVIDNSIIKVVDREYTRNDHKAKFDTTDKAFTDLQLGQDVIDALNNVTLAYTTDAVGNGIEVIPSKGSFDVANFVLANSFRGNILKRSIVIDLNDIENKKFDTDKSYTNVLTKYIVDENGNETNTVDKNGMFLDLLAMAKTKNGGVALVEGSNIAPHRSDIWLKDANINSYFYLQDDDYGLLEVGSYNVMSNIKPESDYFIFEVTGVDAFGVVAGKTVTIDKVEYTIGVDTDKKNDADPDRIFKYLADAKFDSKNVINNISVNGKVQPALNVTMNYAYTENEVTRVIGGKRIFDPTDGISKVYNFVGGKNTVIITTNNGVMVDPKNYTLTNATVDGKADQIIVGTFKIDPITVGKNLYVTRMVKSFNGKAQVPNVVFSDINFANANITVKVEAIKDGVVDSAVDAGSYKFRIRVMSGLLGTNGIPKDITKNVVLDKVTLENGEVLELIGYNDVDDAYFETTKPVFEITKANASMKYRAVDAITFADKMVYIDKKIADNANNDKFDKDEFKDKTLKEFKKAFFKFYNNDIDKLFYGKENPAENIYKYDFALKFVGSKGNVIDESDLLLLPADTYTVTYDMDINNNPVLRNLNIEVAGQDSIEFVVNPKTIDIELSLAGPSEMVYGTKFAGFVAKYTSDNLDWTYIDNKDVNIGFKDEKIVANKTCLNAGVKKFTDKDMNINVGSSHKVGKVTFANGNDSVKVTPKDVTLTFKAGTVNKSYGDNSTIQADLDKLMSVEGLVSENDLTNGAITGEYVFTDKFGVQTVTLAGINSKNYKMTNIPGTIEGVKINIAKANVEAKISSIDVYKKENITEVRLKNTINGETKKVTVSLEGTDFTTEEIEAGIKSHLINKLGLTEDNYVIKIKNSADIAVTDYKPVMGYVFLGVVGALLLVAIIMLISSIVNMRTMPSGFNKDFNFGRDPGKKDIGNLMKAMGKRRDTEYKNVTSQMKKAAKKGMYYNVEDTLFPEPDADEVLSDDEVVTDENSKSDDNE